MIRDSGTVRIPAAMSSEKDDDNPVLRDRSFGGRSPVIRRSPSSGKRRRLPACTPPLHNPNDTPHSFRPEQKFSVPSIGSSKATLPPAMGRAGS